ncbi:MAG: TerC family protein [Thermomicrobiales bacterium]
MSVDPWIWVVTILVIIGFFVFDFFSHVRVPHAPTMKESAWWSVFYIAISIAFGVGLWYVWGGQHGIEFFSGYITEKALSVDNLFVFLIIMTSFRVPREYQQKVLLIGVVMALVMRGIFIALGAAVINQFSWVFYLFGAFLIYTGWKLTQDSGHGGEDEDFDNAFVRLVRRVLPTTDDYHSDAITVKIDGRRFITPMALVIVAIGSADLLFALDSIPAIYGLTQEPYIVFTANAFALMGLRQLYFLLGGLLERLVYLSLGLAAILAFIGVKLIFHAMHMNELSFINGGHHITWALEIPTWLSLVIIIGILVVATVASLVKTRNDPAAGHGTEGASH